MCLVASNQLLTTIIVLYETFTTFLKILLNLSKSNFEPIQFFDRAKYFLAKMVDFTEDQIEDIKDGFDLYDRKGSTDGSLVIHRNAEVCYWTQSVDS